MPSESCSQICRLLASNACMDLPYKSMLGQATIATTILDNVATRPTSSHISRRGTVHMWIQPHAKNHRAAPQGPASIAQERAKQQGSLLCCAAPAWKVGQLIPLTHILLHAPLSCLGQGMPSDLQVGVLGCRYCLAL